MTDLFCGRCGTELHCRTCGQSDDPFNDIARLMSEINLSKMAHDNEIADIRSQNMDLGKALERVLNWPKRFSGGERAEDFAFARRVLAEWQATEQTPDESGPHTPHCNSKGYAGSGPHEMEV